MNEPIVKMCSNLYDKKGNKIDVNILASLYLSPLELSLYFRKCTDYSGDEIKELAKYIDSLPGYDYSRKETAYRKRMIERYDWDFSAPAPASPVSGNVSDFLLLPGETVICVVKPSNGTLIAWCCVLLLFFISLVSTNAPASSIVFLFIFLAYPIVLEICKLKMNAVYLTNKRVVVREGIPRKRSKDIPLSKINGVSVANSNSAYKRGSLRINTSSDNLLFKNMKNPGIFRDHLLAAIETNKADDMKRQAEEIAKAMKQ